MVSSYTTNKRLEKPANGDYVDTWNVPVNGDMDIIDQAFGGTTQLNATGGSAVLTASQYRSMAFYVSGAMSGNVIYSIPANVGGTWIVYNETTDSSGGPYTVTFKVDGSSGTTITAPRGYNVTIYSDGTNVRYADNASVAGGSDKSIQYNVSGAFGGTSTFVYDYTNGRVGVGTAAPSYALDINSFTFAIGTKTASSTNGGSILFRDDTATVRWLAGIIGTAAATSFSIYDVVANELRMAITSSGNVGIGTASPGSKLQVNGTITNTDGTTSTRLAVSSGVGIVGTSTNHPLSIQTNSVERISVATTGKVSIFDDVTVYQSGAVTVGYLYLGNTGTRYLAYDGTKYVLNGAQLQINGQTALNAGNFNTYAPTLTGTGASGTWGISISGSAASATTATTATNLSGGSVSATTMAFNSGYGSTATAYGCRAWVNFNGDGSTTVRGSGNVISVAYNAVGDYTVNIDNDMPDSNYSAVVCASSLGTNNVSPVCQVKSYGPGFVQLRTNGGTTSFSAANRDYVAVAIFR